jgi:hypothetical protein
MLGGSWSSGSAACRAQGDGWDVSACVLAKPGEVEMVKPAAREPARFAEARCNDGTPFGFSVRLAPTPSPVWVIYLEGGVYCDDYSYQCSARQPALTTTPPAGDGMVAQVALGGVFSTDPTLNPDFYDGNQVFAYYCSSDFWAGATAARRPSTGDAQNGWYYSGHANVDAMIALLAERYGLDDRGQPIQLLFGGGSAGAFGSHFNVARVTAALPQAQAAGRIKLFVDAGWMTDWDDAAHRIGAATIADRDVWKRDRDFWAATFDPDCEAAQAADPSVCFMAPNWYPAVAARTPTLIQQCSFDASFTAVHKLAATDASAPAWSAQVTASFSGVNWLFSGSMPNYHTTGTSDMGLSRGPMGNTLRDVLHQFWTGGAPEKVTF